MTVDDGSKSTDKCKSDVGVLSRLPRARTLSIQPTLRCTAECEHCGTLSSPREKVWLPFEHMIAAIDQAAEGQYEVVVFTGGEPMLAGDNLLRAIQHATSYGLSTRVVTNAYWARPLRAARARIRRLVSAGLTEINYSTGDQHARFVPPENVVFATKAAAEAGLNVFIMVELVGRRRVTKQYLEEELGLATIRREFTDVEILVAESPWMPLGPRDKEEYPRGYTVDRSNVALRGGCDSVLSTTTVQADGTIAACCGLGMREIPELHLGDVADTSLAAADATASDDFLKRWLRLEGPERILAWAAEQDPSIEWEGMYAHRCQACIRLYRDPVVRDVVRTRHQSKIPDVLFREWLLFECEAGTDALEE